MRANSTFLIVTPSFYPSTFYGGPSLSLHKFAMALADNETNTNVVVVTSNANGGSRLVFDDGHCIKYATNYKAYYYSVNNAESNSLSFFKGIRNHIKNADVVYIASVFSLSSVVAIFFALRYVKPVVVAPMGQMNKAMFQLSSTLKKKLWLRLFILPFKKKIVWHLKSDQEAKHLVEILPTAKYIKAPNGYNTSDFDAPFETKHEYFRKHNLNKTSDTFFISSIGRIHSQKNFDVLIQAFAKLKANNPHQSFLLVIAGPDNGEKNNLISLINNLGLNDDVIFFDYVEGDAKTQLLKTSDCFALPSSGENFGQVYLEALACGTPIISSTHTPWTNVEALGIGYCAAPTTDSVYEKLQKMYQHRNNISRERCIRYARENFEWSAVANLFMQQLKSFVNESSA